MAFEDEDRGTRQRGLAKGVGWGQMVAGWEHEGTDWGQRKMGYNAQNLST